MSTHNDNPETRNPERMEGPSVFVVPRWLAIAVALLALSSLGGGFSVAMYLNDFAKNTDVKTLTKQIKDLESHVSSNYVGKNRTRILVYEDDLKALYLCIQQEIEMYDSLIDSIIETIKWRIDHTVNISVTLIKLRNREDLDSMMQIFEYELSLDKERKNVRPTRQSESGLELRILTNKLNDYDYRLQPLIDKKPNLEKCMLAL
ncbi:MAG: hypothetical protein Rhims3KO_36070 [Hyphomicrobiales bacterium]